MVSTHAYVYTLAIYGRNLQDTDRFLAGDSDPYVRVEAYDTDGHTSSRQTRAIGGNENLTWNQPLDFGAYTWMMFRVKVYNDDWSSGNDSLSN